MKSLRPCVIAAVIEMICVPALLLGVLYVTQKRAYKRKCRELMAAAENRDERGGLRQ